MNCSKCGKKLVDCHACGGNPNPSALGGLTTLTCKACNNKGKVCPDHGAR